MILQDMVCQENVSMAILTYSKGEIVSFCGKHVHQELVICITKTWPYNIHVQRFLSSVKIEDFTRKMLIFLIFLLKT